MASLLDYDIRHRGTRKVFSTQRYPRTHQVGHEEIFPVVSESDTMTKRLTATSETAKMDDSIATIPFPEWEFPCSSFYPGLIDNDPLLDPTVSCAMPSMDRQMLPVSSTSGLPVSGYSNEERMLDVDQQTLATSMVNSQAGAMCMEIPILEKQKVPAVPKYDSMFSQVPDGEMADASTNWQHVSEGTLKDPKDSGLAEMLGGYTVNERQTVQARSQFPHQAVTDNHGGSYSWSQAKRNFAPEPDSAHQRYNHQFQYVGFVGPSQSEMSPESTRKKSGGVHSAENMHPKTLRRSESARKGSKAPQRLGLSRSMPSRWKDWSEIRISMRNNHFSGLATHDKQVMLKRILCNLLPMIDKRSKNLRKHALDDRSKYDHSSSSPGRARIAGNYNATAVQNNVRMEQMQDPAAKTHMLAERRRRHRENEYYAALRALIAPTSRLDKAAVLGETIKLVDRLKETIRTLQGSGNQPQSADDNNCKGNPSAHSISDRSPNLMDEATASQGSEHSDEQAGTGSPTTGQAATEPTPLQMDESKASDETLKVESTSEDQQSHMKPSAKQELPELVKEEADDSREEILEVLLPDREPQNQLRVKVHTSKRAPDTVLRMLICLKELSLQVTSSDITMNRDWTHANFHLQMNEDQSRRSSLFRVEVQTALKTTMACSCDFDFGSKVCTHEDSKPPNSPSQI